MCFDKKRKKKRWPKPNHFKIDEENWGNAVKSASQKKKPKDGWPDKPKKKS